jgi:hypothetical protein
MSLQNAGDQEKTAPFQARPVNREEDSRARCIGYSQRLAQKG